MKNVPPPRSLLWLLAITTGVLIFRFGLAIYAKQDTEAHMPTLPGLSTMLFSIIAPLIAAICTLAASIICFKKSVRKDPAAFTRVAILVAIALQTMFLFTKILY